MDKIFLQEISFLAVIGIHEYEKAQPQMIWLDLEAQIDASKSAVTDQITSTVDYAAIYHFLKDFITNTRFQLLESLAQAIAEKLFDRFSIPWLRLTLRKKPQDLPDLKSVAVIIERSAIKTAILGEF